ncbi:membrane protein S2 [Saimiriine betaherpesvirus 4]|uniref:Membrane protein S2 n=1 Tax=Saimiriine betaherpesvirus 4 TaxID=1535247 RepID=G8XSS0_9BETA|nr:membrane protein S2 [Saimiriine betaherpesvirus 4]AEV80872.1 membrane protein S2 [Saimiriine betaherpesvirus 4]
MGNLAALGVVIWTVCFGAVKPREQRYECVQVGHQEIHKGLCIDVSGPERPTVEDYKRMCDVLRLPNGGSVPFSKLPDRIMRDCELEKTVTDQERKELLMYCQHACYEKNKCVVVESRMQCLLKNGRLNLKLELNGDFSYGLKVESVEFYLYNGDAVRIGNGVDCKKMDTKQYVCEENNVAVPLRAREFVVRTATCNVCRWQSHGCVLQESVWDSWLLLNMEDVMRLEIEERWIMVSIGVMWVLLRTGIGVCGGVWLVMRWKWWRAMVFMLVWVMVLLMQLWPSSAGEYLWSLLGGNQSVKDPDFSSVGLVSGNGQLGAVRSGDGKLVGGQVCVGADGRRGVWWTARRKRGVCWALRHDVGRAAAKRELARRPLRMA